MSTIKLKSHITVKQMMRWRKMGVIFDCVGYSFFALTDDSLVIKLINEANV